MCVGNIMAVSRLATKVYLACKDTPDDFRHISEEVMSLQAIVNMAVPYFETPLSDNDKQLGQEVLRGCQSALEDLNSLIEKHPTPTNAHQALGGVKLSVRALKARFISNTSLLNGFIQRFDTLLLPLGIMLISPL